MKIDPRRWRLTGGIWGIVGVATVAVVLALVVMMIPRTEVAATVNGERITVEDVEEMEARYKAYDMPISYDQALDYLITETVLFQQAYKGGYVPPQEEAESSLETQLAMTGMSLEAFKEELGRHDITYDEYLEGFRREMAIHEYLEAAVEVTEVTEEEAREFYDDYAEQHPDEDLPSFEDAKPGIIQMLEQERQQDAQAAIQLLIEELREEATIEYG